MPINKSVSFKVNGMHCESCANKIKNSMKELKVQSLVNVDISKGQVKIEFNPDESSISSFKDSITKLGFQVEKVEFE